MAKEKKGTHKIYTDLYQLAATITVFALELYSSFELSFLAFPNVSGALQYVLKALVFVLHWACFSCLFMLLRFVIISIKKARWKKKHPGYDIDGIWLHIHDKEKVRIGVVEIKQDFYDLSVCAENIPPQSDEDRRTRWHYVGTEFKPDENATILLMGCYFAQKENEASKQGIHLFREFHSDNGVITRMTGEFADTISVENAQKPATAHDKTGKILLFRMTDEIKEYISFKSIDDYDRRKLRWIISEKENRSVIESDYVKTLQTVYYKNEFRRKWSELKKALGDSSDVDIVKVENSIYNMIAYAMFADNEVDKQETATLKSLTGISRDLADYPVLKKDTVLSDIKEVIDILSPNADALRLFRLMLCDSCRSIILCNSNNSNQEKSFMSELEEVVKQTC